jgi:MOSC domain-containing protein YiiM
LGEIIAVCTSKEKGEKKENIKTGTLKENYGVIGDAHADSETLRQVSLLATESIDKMSALGFDVGPGDFAENLTIKGLILDSLKIGIRLKVGEDVLLEITQIGKDCHSGCAIFKKIGKCIMPKEGIFAKVIKGGDVKVGDEIKISIGTEI